MFTPTMSSGRTQAQTFYVCYVTSPDINPCSPTRRCYGTYCIAINVPIASLLDVIRHYEHVLFCKLLITLKIILID